MLPFGDRVTANRFQFTMRSLLLLTAAIAVVVWALTRLGAQTLLALVPYCIAMALYRANTQAASAMIGGAAIGLLSALVGLTAWSHGGRPLVWLLGVTSLGAWIGGTVGLLTQRQITAGVLSMSGAIVWLVVMFSV